MSIFSKSSEEQQQDLPGQSASEAAGQLPMAGNTVEAPGQQEAGKPKTLPFTFAKRNGVLVKEVREGEAVVLSRPDVSHLIVAELRRHLGMPVRLELISPDEFDAQLQRHESLENALILEAFDDDIGVGD